VSASLVCTQSLHLAFKSDDTLWSTLPCIGVMAVEADDDGPGYGLEMRNCVHCHSTLCREVQS
jgi:hypothetical protein